MLKFTFFSKALHEVAGWILGLAKVESKEYDHLRFSTAGGKLPSAGSQHGAAKHACGLSQPQSQPRTGQNTTQAINCQCTVRSSHLSKPGHRLVPAAIDELAHFFPERAWASLPIDDDDLSKGLEDITYDALSNAINKLAWFIKLNMGMSTTFETITYLGSADVRYHMVQMAVCKTGHKVLFSSHINPPQAHLSLMDQMDSKMLLSTSGFNVQHLLEARKMSHSVIPSLDELLDLNVRVPPFPYTKTFEEARDDPFLVLHTSGTMGDPKPIIWTHARLAAPDAVGLLPDVEGRKHVHRSRDVSETAEPFVSERFFLPTAPYHVLSTALGWLESVFTGDVIIPGFRNRCINLSELCDFLDHAKPTKGFIVPNMMEIIAQRPDARRIIEPLKEVYFGGTVLSPAAGDVFAKHTRLQNIFGSTEVAAPPQLEADNEDRGYCFFDMVHSGIEFRPVGAEWCSDDEKPAQAYEMIFILTPESAKCSAWHAGNAITLESSSGRGPCPEFATRDLWTPHPDPAKAKYVWRYAGRADDLVTLSTGLGIHPAPWERALAAHDGVEAAVFIGHGHQQGALLIEVAEGIEPTPVLLGELWKDVVVPMNEKMPIQGRVDLTHVVLVPAGGFERTPKGSVSKKRTETKFSDMLDHVYEVYGDGWRGW